LKLGERLVRRVAALLRQFVLEPRRLKLELLESAFLGRQAEAIAQTVRQLRGIGVIVALDDFGTGYASLTHVKQFDIRHLKIDRSFIKDICDDPSDAAITRAIIDLGRNLGILVTAEGIELPEQLALLRAADCDRGQGYLFSPPMPAEHVPAFLKRWYGGMSRALLGVTPAAVPVDGDGG
jgi:EAL domain-containing protein (putative c-di-GMP-specific phosphodiesterase class I)